MIDKYIKFTSRIDSILGINERNLEFINKYNPISARKIANDKIATKKLLNENGINTPKLVSIIKSYQKLETYKFNKLPGSIVVKPRKGFGGEGIIVFFSKNRDGNWLKADKTEYSPLDLKNHVVSILDGNYSLSGTKDYAFFEERVISHPIFKRYSYKSVPDIRVIVFNGVPVMAMLRLGTKVSDGKANLHKGAIAVGIDISRGITTSGVQNNRIIEYHPDYDTILRGFRIPYWEKILTLAVDSQKIIGLGYLGVDIVIDRIKGPMIMELNARPGLSIQVANNDGLKNRLKRVKGLKIKSVQRGIQVGKNLFGGEVEEEIEEISGKQLVGYVENVILYSGEVSYKIKSRNDSGALWSTLDFNFAKKLGFEKILTQFLEFKSKNTFSTLKEGRKVKQIANEYFKNNEQVYKVGLVKQTSGLELRIILAIYFEMSGIKQLGRFSVTNREQMLYPCIIGRKDLKKKFLIDPEKSFLSTKR